MSHEAYAVVQTYYQHGAYSLQICYGQDDLRNHLINCYERYASPAYEINDLHGMELDEVIKIVISEGNYQIENQVGFGWGVREVREI